MQQWLFHYCHFIHIIMKPLLNSNMCGDIIILEYGAIIIVLSGIILLCKHVQ